MTDNQSIISHICTEDRYSTENKTEINGNQEQRKKLIHNHLFVFCFLLVSYLRCYFSSFGYFLATRIKKILFLQLKETKGNNRSAFVIVSVFWLPDKIL